MSGTNYGYGTSNVNLGFFDQLMRSPAMAGVYGQPTNNYSTFDSTYMGGGATGMGSNAMNSIDIYGNPVGGQSTGFASGVPTDSSLNWWGGVDAAGNQVNGIVPTSLATGSALAQTWLGFRNYGLAQDQLNFQRDAYNQNYAMQRDAYDRNVANQEAAQASQER